MGRYRLAVRLDNCTIIFRLGSIVNEKGIGRTFDLMPILKLKSRIVRDPLWNSDCALALSSLCCLVY